MQESSEGQSIGGTRSETQPLRRKQNSWVPGMLPSARKNVERSGRILEESGGSVGSLLKNATDFKGFQGDQVSEEVGQYDSRRQSNGQTQDQMPNQAKSGIERIETSRGDPDGTARMCTQQGEIGLTTTVTTEDPGREDRGSTGGDIYTTQQPKPTESNEAILGTAVKCIQRRWKRKKLSREPKWKKSLEPPARPRNARRDVINDCRLEDCHYEPPICHLFTRRTRVDCMIRFFLEYP